MTGFGPGELPEDPRLNTWLALVEARWKSFGLSPLTRGEMRARLVEDLIQSLDGGAAVDDLIDVNPGAFADEVAVALRHPLPASNTRPAARKTLLKVLPERTRFVAGAMFGAFLGAIMALYLAQDVGFGLLDSLAIRIGSNAEVLLTLAIFVAAAMFTAASGGFAVDRLFRDSPMRDRLARSAVVALLLSGALATPLTMAFAATTGFSDNAGVVLLEFAIVLVTLIVGLAFAARVTWRRHPAATVQD